MKNNVQLMAQAIRHTDSDGFTDVSLIERRMANSASKHPGNCLPPEF